MVQALLFNKSSSVVGVVDHEGNLVIIHDVVNWQVVVLKEFPFKA